MAVTRPTFMLALYANISNHMPLLRRDVSKNKRRNKSYGAGAHISRDTLTHKLELPMYTLSRRFFSPTTPCILSIYPSL